MAVDITGLPAIVGPHGFNAADINRADVDASIVAITKVGLRFEIGHRDGSGATRSRPAVEAIAATLMLPANRRG